MSLRDLITHYSQSQPATQEDDEDVLKVVHSQLQQTQDNTQPWNFNDYRPESDDGGDADGDDSSSDDERKLEEHDENEEHDQHDEAPRHPKRSKDKKSLGGCIVAAIPLKPYMKDLKLHPIYVNTPQVGR